MLVAVEAGSHEALARMGTAIHQGLAMFDRRGERRSLRAERSLAVIASERLRLRKFVPDPRASAAEAHGPTLLRDD